MASLFAEDVRDELPRVRVLAMLPDEDALPDAESHAEVEHRSYALPGHGRHYSTSSGQRRNVSHP